jgi:hypothetical protein
MDEISSSTLVKDFSLSRLKTTKTLEMIETKKKEKWKINRNEILAFSTHLFSFHCILCVFLFFF